MTFDQAGQWGPHPVLSSSGQALPAATFEVFEEDGTTPAVLFTDESKGTVESQPVNVDPLGNATFFAVPGRYVIKFTVGGASTSFDVPAWVDPSDVISRPEADAAFEPVMRVDIRRHGGGSAKTAAENTAAYDAIAAAYPNQQVIVGIPWGVDKFHFDPLPMVQEVKIDGAGYGSVVKFTGNVHCFTFDGIFRSGVSNVRVEVDTTNTSDVFRFLGGSTAGGTGICSQNVLEDIWVDTPNGNNDPDPANYGAYTGIRMTGWGCWQNNIRRVTVNNCAIGAALVTTDVDQWVTFNQFEQFYVRTFADTAILLSEAPSSSVIHNTFDSPYILDWDRHNATTRTGIKLSGAGNNFVAVQTFADGLFGTFNALDFDDTGQRSYGNLITGTIEGWIAAEEKAVNHSVDVFTFKKRNYSDLVSGTAPNGRIRTTQVTNLLPASEFRSDTAHGWTPVAVTAAIEAATQGVTREQIRLTKTNAAGTLAEFTLTADPALLPTFKGKYVTFTAGVIADVGGLVEVVLKDGVSSPRRGMRHTGSGGPEVLSTEMKVSASATLLTVSVRFMADAPVNTEAVVQWVNLNYGFGGPQTPIAPLRDRAYVEKATQRLTLSAGELAASLGSPALATIGTFYAGWMLDSATTETVAGTLIVPKGWGSCKVVGWFANAGAGAGDFVVRLLTIVGRVDGASIGAGTAPSADVTVTAGAQNVVSKVTLNSALNVLEDTMVVFAVERRGAAAGDTLGNDLALLAVEIQRAS